MVRGFAPNIRMLNISLLQGALPLALEIFNFKYWAAASQLRPIFSALTKGPEGPLVVDFYYGAPHHNRCNR